MYNDAVIANKVREAILLNPRISAQDIIITCFDRVVTLTGDVDMPEQAVMAEETAAGIEGVLSEAILTDLWIKFVLLASNAGVMALTRLPVGKLRDDADINAMFGAAYEEVVAVGRALGVALPADIVERTFTFNRNAPPHLMASMAVDLLRGNRRFCWWMKSSRCGRETMSPIPNVAWLCPSRPGSRRS